MDAGFHKCIASPESWRNQLRIWIRKVDLTCHCTRAPKCAGEVDVRPHLNPFPIQLERLRRHSEQAANTYDHISLLDLSHTLRIWADLRSQIQHAPELATTLAFKSSVPVKKLVRALRDRPYILFSMPSAVHTAASKNQLGFTGDGVHGGGNATVGAITRFNEDGSLDISAYYYVKGEVEPPLRRLLGEG